MQPPFDLYMTTQSEQGDDDCLYYLCTVEEENKLYDSINRCIGDVDIPLATPTVAQSPPVVTPGSLAE
eukprot:2747822-Rhodomonas_salina.1